MNTTETNTISQDISKIINGSLLKAMSYKEYRDFVTDLVTKGKSTGEDQSEALVDYTMLNDTRMKRLDKTLNFSDDVVAKIEKIEKKITWLVLTESWCGDAAQTMPIMNKMAKLNSNIVFKVILRDENLELMNHFLTNNTLSIPKLIMIDDNTNEILADWGPRPNIATEMVNDFKNEHGLLTAEFKQNLQTWYTKDKGQSTAEDILASLLLK